MGLDSRQGAPEQHRGAGHADLGLSGPRGLDLLSREVFLGEVDELVGQQGPAEEIALGFVAAPGVQELQLLVDLDPFGDDLEAEA